MPHQGRTLPEPVPSRAWEIARVAGEAVRALNHATHPGAVGGPEGYVEPADLDAVLVELSLLAGWLPQALDQGAAWLAAHHAAGAVRHDTRPAQTGQSVAAVVGLLRDAHYLAANLADALDEARQYTARLAGGPDGAPAAGGPAARGEGS